MKKLLIIASIIACAGYAQAQSGAEAAAKAAEAARAAAAGARTVGTGAKATTSLGAGASAAAATTKQGMTVSDLLKQAGSANESAVGTCSSTILGHTDARQAFAAGTLKEGSACATNKLSVAALDTAAALGNAAAAELKGTTVAKASLALKARALNAQVKTLATLNKISEAQAKSNIKQLCSQCDIIGAGLCDAKVISTMEAL